MGAPRIKFELTGFEAYLERLKKAGADIDVVVSKAIAESVKPIEKDILSWAEKHKLTGATLKGVEVSKIKRSGGFIYAEVGIDVSGNSAENPNAWHAVFVEYGTPTNPADPGVRTAFISNKSKVKRIQKKILEEGGIL